MPMVSWFVSLQTDKLKESWIMKFVHTDYTANNNNDNTNDIFIFFSPQTDKLK